MGDKTANRLFRMSLVPSTAAYYYWTDRQDGKPRVRSFVWAIVTAIRCWWPRPDIEGWDRFAREIIEMEYGSEQR